MDNSDGGNELECAFLTSEFACAPGNTFFDQQSLYNKKMIINFEAVSINWDNWNILIIK